jgi:hypothetical protein
LTGAKPFGIGSRDGGGIDGAGKKFAGYRWFESISLQRRVRCEPDFLSRVDHVGEVLDVLVQRRRDDSRAALRLMRKLLKEQGFAPRLLVTDKLRSYASAFRTSCCYPRFPRNTHPPAFAELWCQLPRPGLPTVTRLPSVIPWRLSGRVFREASHRSRTRPPTPQRSRSLAALGSKRALPHISRGRVLRLSRRKSISDPPALASAALGMINTISRDQLCQFRIG